MNPPRQSGNALFLILIAVTLFAALSYAITQSSRGSGGIDKEIALVGTTRMLAFANDVRGAVQRLTVLNNTTANNLHFNNDTYIKWDGSPIDNGVMGNPADPSLYIFHAQGGGVAPQLFEDIATQSCSGCISSNYGKAGHVQIKWKNVPGVGTAAADIALMIYNPSDTLCKAINKMLGISTPLPLLAAGSGETFTTGDPTPALSAISGPDVGAITGKTAFCYQQNSSPNANIFMYVLQEN